MRKHRFVLGVLAVMLPFWAYSQAATDFETSSEVELTEVQANILQGDWSIGGQLSFDRYSDNEDTSFRSNLSARYFLIEHLAIGLGFGLDAQSGKDTIASLGPELGYVFWTHEMLAAFAGIGVKLGLTDATVSSFVQGTLGLQYFITPAVALGPSVYATHYNSRYDGRDFQRYGLLFSFGIFL